MGKVVYRKEKKSRSPYPLLILGVVVIRDRKSVV